ncbi:MAG: glycosyltransferase family 39 protein [Deltaproteobacteria bacterium]|nr:glycosyltransferase family 39 protein [Deltaproteobacteria bacterium]
MTGRGSPSDASSDWPWLTALFALLAVLGLAAYLRAVGLDWDEDARLHPDERFLSMVEDKLAPVGSLEEYFDTERSSLNPNNRGHAFFVYGNLPITLVQYLGQWFAQPDNDLDRRWFGTDLTSRYSGVHLLGRGVSVVCDLLTTVLVFAIGLRLYGRGVGLLSAALYAGAVLPIQQAHFFTVDAIATLFATLAFWLAVRASSGARWSDDILFGLALGAGLASKLSILPVALLLVLSLVVRLSVQREARPAQRDPAADRRQRAAGYVRAALSLNLAFLMALLAFRILQPYAFLPTYAGTQHSGDVGARVIRQVVDVVGARINPDWREQMGKLRNLQSGADDSPPNHQWATRTPIGFAWLNLVRFGLGWPLGLTAWLGWAWALVEGVRGRSQSWRHVLPVAWVGVFFAWYGAGWVMSMRYLLPLYPILAVLAAWALLRITAPQLDASRPEATPAPIWRRVLGSAAIAVVLGSTWAYAYAFTRIYTRPHPRLAASRWIYEHIPADVTLTLETASGTTTRQVGLYNTWLAPGASPTDKTAPGTARTRIGDEAAVEERFRLAQPGTLTALRLHDIRDASTPPSAHGLRVELLGERDALLARCDFDAPFPPPDAAPASRACAIDRVALSADTEYRLRLRARDGALLSTGATIANEGHWDDPVPVPLRGYDPWNALYQMWGLEMAMEDDADKRARMQHILDRSDYLVISSNRFYGSLPRNPQRWPMSVAYYQALFSGALGFALVRDFASYPEIGGWRIDDQPAEEAFTVYDHPRVLLFAKRADYDPARTAAVLNGVDLNQVVRRPAAQVFVTPAPVAPPPAP